MAQPCALWPSLVLWALRRSGKDKNNSLTGSAAVRPKTDANSLCFLSFCPPPPPSRWSGFLLCSVAMLLVIFPMFSFPKKLPPRHKKKRKRVKVSLDELSGEEEVLKKSPPVSSAMGFGRDIKGRPGCTHDVILSLVMSSSHS